MNQKILFLLFILVTIQSSCSKKINPNEGYIQLKNKYAENLNQLRSTVSEELKVNKQYKYNLNLNDPVLYYLDTIASNFKKFSVELDSNKKYKIKVNSLCNCFGFKKYIFIPQIYSADLSDNINLKLDSTYFNYEKGPLSLNRKWILESETASNSSKFEFLVFSDNTNLSEKIYNFIATSTAVTNGAFIPVFVPINIKSTLVGDFYVEIEEY